MKKKSILFVTVLMILGFITILFFYRQQILKYPSTDNAYLRAGIVSISSEVSGKVAKILVRNNQYVTKGYPLINIDSADYETALKKAQANLELTKQQLEIDKQAVIIAEAKMREYQAKLQQANREVNRLSDLAKTQLVAKSQLEDAITNTEIINQTVFAANIQLKQAITKLGHKQDNFEIKKAESEVKKAELELARTTILAPAYGFINNLTLEEGDFVSIGKPLFALINNEKWWVDANYKETQLRNIKVGQQAEISLDLYPEIKLKGIVESISDGSSNTFSLLPAENATGNWIKVTQRFQIRIAIHDIPKGITLRTGASAKVTVNTHSDS